LQWYDNYYFKYQFILYINSISGDSGGGLMLKLNGQWILRGIVSVALIGNDGYCDANNFVVFTDVAQFVPWIKNNIKNY
jgi:secreted trypsin-like serine protease